MLPQCCVEMGWARGLEEWALQKFLSFAELHWVCQQAAEEAPLSQKRLGHW